MIKFNADKIRDMLAEYLYNDELNGKRDPKIFDILEYLFEQMSEIENFDYQRGEVDRVLNSFQLCIDSEMTRENIEGVRGVKSPDVAFIASHYGFIFGLLCAENARLHFSDTGF